MMRIQIKEGLGFVPLLGGQIAASTVSSVASLVPSLFKNPAWDNIGGGLDTLNQAADSTTAQAHHLIQGTDQLIHRIENDIRSNASILQQNQISNSGIDLSDDEQKTKLIGFLLFGALATAGAVYYFNINKNEQNGTNKK